MKNERTMASPVHNAARPKPTPAIHSRRRASSTATAIRMPVNVAVIRNRARL
jgi:hypothetical protein